VAVVTPFAEELVASFCAVDEWPEVLYEPDPLPSTRYPGDHRGVDRFSRDAEAERRCQRLLGCAEVLLGIPDDSPAARAAVVRSHPESRSVKGAAAGAGEQVKAAGLTTKELERVAGMCATGVHVTPLAEFCPPGLHAHDRKDLR
jgi:hypothetical protein